MDVFFAYFMAESTILYVLADSHLGIAKVSSEAYLTTGGHLMLPTRPEAGKFLKLKPLERVLQVSKTSAIFLYCEAADSSSFL